MEDKNSFPINDKPNNKLEKEINTIKQNILNKLENQDESQNNGQKNTEVNNYLDKADLMEEATESPSRPQYLSWSF